MLKIAGNASQRRVWVGAPGWALLANRAEFFLNWLALNALGVSIVPLNHEGTAEDLAYIVGNSGLLMIVTLPDYQSLADAIAVELGPRFRLCWMAKRRPRRSWKLLRVPLTQQVSAGFVYVGQHWKAQRVHAVERLFSVAWRMVSGSGWVL